MSNARGFSLIEVLIAMLILAGGVMVVANGWSGNFNRLQKSRINNNVAALLQRKMTEIEILYKDKSLEEIKESDGGDFEEFPDFKWKMTSQEFDMPDITSALTAGQEHPDPMLAMIGKQITEYVHKVVKEVTVTVIYRSPKTKKEITNAVTTYFVDYKKDVPMAGIGGDSGAAGSSGSSGTAGAPHP